MRLVCSLTLPPLLLLHAVPSFAQSIPSSPGRPAPPTSVQQIGANTNLFRDPRFIIDPARTYSLSELIDLAEAHNPETRVAWERARAQLAALGVARSELFPTLAAAAVSNIDRDEVLLGSRFFRQTVQTFAGSLDLAYTVFDFGGRAARIEEARAAILAANFAFNDTHRRIIYQVQQAYYSLLNAMGQEDAAQASLTNAQAVQQAAEDRLKQGLATLPDVLEARAATAQAQYDLQAILGAEDISRGNLSTALGASPASTIRVQPISQISPPDSIPDTVDQVINRAFEQRPDLLQQFADIRSANSRVKEARSPFYPTLTLNASPSARSLYGLQQTLPWGHTADLVGSVNLTLSWTVFDGGARKKNLEQAEAAARAEEAKLSVTRNRIADEIWTAYTLFRTALGQRKAATALLEASSQSYAAALESYNYGVRSLLDVTAAQRVLAQARSTDVTAQTQVLVTLAQLAFEAADSIQPGARRP